MAEENKSQSLFMPVGWAAGFLFSVIFPKLTAPLGLSILFDLGGSLSGMLGVAIMFWFLGKRNVSGGKKFRMAGGVLVIGLGAFAWYKHLQLAPEHVTPSAWIVALELMLYWIACFGICAVLACIYWYAGPSVFRMFGKAPVGGG